MNIVAQYLIIITIAFSFFLKDGYSQQHWVKQPFLTSKNLTNIFFTDTLNGWIAGDSGIIIHTSDNGQNWTIQNSGVPGSIESIYFVNSNTGYALSWEFDNTPPIYYGTRILSTTNGGNNWTNYLFRDTNLFLNCIYFFDPQNGYMAGSEGKIFYTSNSGINWSRALVDSALITAFPVEKIQFYNSLSGYAVGGAFDVAGMVWKTTNGGRNWKSDIVGAEPLNDIHIINSSEAICVGGDYEFGVSRITTTNSGANWVYTEFGFFGIGRSIDYRIPGEGWISLGIVDSFIVTTNNGASWLLRGTPAGTQIFDLIFTNSNNGWAVGHNGAILKYSSTVVNISENNELNPEFAILYQNYPNPFNPETKIIYKISGGNNQSGFRVKLSVYDILGNEISELVNDRQTAGNYVVKFNASDLPSGIYFVKLFTGDNHDVNKSSLLTKKILLLK